jgi:hypothetical protein
MTPMERDHMVGMGLEDGCYHGLIGDMISPVIVEEGLHNGKVNHGSNL